MFAPRRLCVYPPPLLASISPSAKFFVSPTYTKSSDNSFVSPTYANSGGGGLRFQSAAPPTSSHTFNCPRRSPSSKHLTITDSVTDTIKVGAPTFPYRESPIFYSLLSNFLAPAVFLPLLKLITVNLQRNVGAPTFSNCSSKGAESERAFQGTGRWSLDTVNLATFRSRVTDLEDAVIP